MQVFIYLNRALGRQGHADLLEAKIFGVGLAADCQQHFVEGNSDGAALVFGFHEMFTVDCLKFEELMACKYVDALL